MQRALWLPPDTSGSRCPTFNPRPDLCLKGLRSQAAPSAKFLWTWCPRFRASAISPIAFSNAADAETSRSCRRRLTITLFRSEQNGTAVTLRPLQAAFYHRNGIHRRQRVCMLPAHISLVKMAAVSWKRFHSTASTTARRLKGQGLG